MRSPMSVLFFVLPLAGLLALFGLSLRAGKH